MNAPLYDLRSRPLYVALRARAVGIHSREWRQAADRMVRWWLVGGAAIGAAYWWLR